MNFIPLVDIKKKKNLKTLEIREEIHFIFTQEETIIETKGMKT